MQEAHLVGTAAAMRDQAAATAERRAYAVQAVIVQAQPSRGEQAGRFSDQW